MSTTKSVSGKQALLIWCQKTTQDYQNVSVTNFTTSWSDGLAFCAIIHKHRPEALNYSALSADNPAHNHGLAFRVGENLGIPALLDVEDMLIPKPEPHSVMTYLSQYYHFFTSGSVRGNGAGISSVSATLSSNQNQKPNAEPVELCAKCAKPLSGSVAKSKGKVYHASCFTCASCSAPLRSRCIMVENTPYCEKCAKTAVAKAGGGAPSAAAAGGTISRMSERRSFSNMNISVDTGAKELEEKQARVDKQKEAVMREKERLVELARQEAEEKARKEKEEEARQEAEEKARLEREERMRVERERQRREQELKDKEAQERLERVRREREEMEREARAREAREAEERERLLREQREKKEQEERERLEREERLRLERERKQKEEEQRQADALARIRGHAPSVGAPSSPAAESGEASKVGGVKKKVFKGGVPPKVAPAATSESNDDVPEWQRRAKEIANKRAVVDSPLAQRKNTVGSQSSSAGVAEWQSKAAAVHSHHVEDQQVTPAEPAKTPTKFKTPGGAGVGPRKDLRGSSDGVTDWQNKAAQVHAHHVDEKVVVHDAPSSPKVAVKKKVPPPAVPGGPVKRPVKEGLRASQDSSPVNTPPQSDTPVKVGPELVTPLRLSKGAPPRPPRAESPVVVDNDSPSKPTRPPPSAPVKPEEPKPVEEPIKSPRIVVTPTSDEPPKSPRSPRYSARPPPAVPEGGETPQPKSAREMMKFPSFGVSLSEIMESQKRISPTEKLPLVWITLVRMLKAGNGLVQEGIFRMSGASFDIDRLKETLNKGSFDVQFDGDVHIVACAIKQWISELSDPLIPRTLYESVMEPMWELPINAESTVMMPFIYQSIRDLPTVNRNVLLAFVQLMKEVLAESAANRMSEANLAICFSPGLFQSKIEDPMLYVRTTQIETKWVEMLLRYPPSDYDMKPVDARLAIPRGSAGSRRGSVAMSPFDAKALMMPTQRASLALGEKKASSMSALPIGGAAATVQTQPDRLATSAGSASDDFGDVVSTYVVTGEVLQGYLMKENPNGLTKLWKRRWFVHHGKRLLYYADAKSGGDRGEGLKGFIPLQRASVSALPGYAKREFAFAIITPERTFHLQAADGPELHYWISSLHDLFESAAMQAPESEFTSASVDAGNLLPAREFSFAKDAFAGELERMGALKIWKKRHVVLSDGILYAFKKNGDRKPAEKVFLYGSHLEEYNPSDTECVAFKVRAATGSDIVLRAPSPEVMASWTNAILRHRLAVSESIDNIGL